MSRNIIQDKLAEAKLMNAHARRREVRKYLDYYSGTSTESYIKKYFSGDAFTEIPPTVTNFTRKFINKISRIYTLGAKRNVANNDLYKKLTPTKGVRMKHAERMTRLIGTIANRVMWKDDKFDYRPIYYFESFFGTDPFTPEAITYPLLNKVADVSDTIGLQWEYWDSEIVAILDEDGKIVSEQPNPYGILPFVFTHREDQLDSFLVEGAGDIINCNEQVNIGLTELNLGMRFNMFGQPWMTGGQFTDSNIARAGSNEILDMGVDGAYNITSPQGDVAGAIEEIKFQIELIALNNHLWVQWAESGGEVPSGISLMIKDLERKEDYFDDLDLWRMYEQDFFRVESVIAQYNGHDLGDTLGIDFEEVEYPMTVQDQIMMDTFNLENHITTRAKIMVRDNKDLTVEQAQSIIKENESTNSEFSGGLGNQS